LLILSQTNIASGLEFVDAGGLISYGPNLPAHQRRVADYVSMIFKGSKPGDIPVE